MEVGAKDPWYFLLLIIISVLKASSVKENTVVHLEEGMVLECWCPWNGTLTMVNWSKDSRTIAVFHPEFGVSLRGNYKERVTFLRTSDMDGSISLKNVTHQDIGVFVCSIQTFPNGPWTKTFEVEDLDEPPEIDEEEEDRDDTQEQATEWPKAEEAQADMELEAEVRSNLTVHCDQKQNHSLGQVLMERQQSGQWKTIGICQNVDDQIVTQDYSDRGQIFCTEQLNVHLQLTGVIPEDGGLYRCISTMDVGNQTTTVRVTVATTGGFSLSLYMMYVYIGIGVAVLVLLNVVIILTIRHRKTNLREEYRVAQHPFQKQPNFYENILVVPNVPRLTKVSKNSPIYANIRVGRARVK